MINTIEVSMTIHTRKELTSATALILLLLVSLLVMAAYIPEKRNNKDHYDNSRDFIKTLKTSAFNRNKLTFPAIIFFGALVPTILQT